MFLTKIMNFYVNHANYQKYLRTFPYPEGEALLFLVSNPNLGLKQLILSQFRSNDNLILTLRGEPATIQAIAKTFSKLSADNDIPFQVPQFDHHAQGHTLKLTVPLENRWLILNLLAELEKLMTSNQIDKLNFSFLSDLLRGELNSEPKFSLDGRLLTVSTESDIIDIRVANLTDLVDITQKIELERIKARNLAKKFLTLRIIQDDHTQPMYKAKKPEYIYLGIGYPSLDESNKGIPVPIEHFENIVREIRGVSNFTYSDSIVFVNNTILQFGAEELALTNESKFRLSEIPNFEPDFFEIRYINDDIGFAVFARKDIAKGSKLGIFSGLNGLPLTSYGYSLIDINPALGEGLCEIAPERFGNWTHIVNHAPLEPITDEAHKDVIADGIKNKIELANIHEQWIEINGYQYPILISDFIPKGKQVLFDYEPYWFNWQSRHGKLCYFVYDNGAYSVVNNKGEIAGSVEETKGACLIKQVIAKYGVRENKFPQSDTNNFEGRSKQTPSATSLSSSIQNFIRPEGLLNIRTESKLEEEELKSEIHSQSLK